jgi:hypothetical protein
VIGLLVVGILFLRRYYKKAGAGGREKNASPPPPTTGPVELSGGDFSQTSTPHGYVHPAGYAAVPQANQEYDPNREYYDPSKGYYSPQYQAPVVEAPNTPAAGHVDNRAELASR